MTDTKKKLIVIALGGNAINQSHQKGTAEEQFENVQITCNEIVKLNELGYKVLVTHGNGPQSGSLLIQHEEGKKLVPPQPLDIIGGMTQGQIGYMFQNCLQNSFIRKNRNLPIATCVTQVLVDPNDPDFNDPSKPVGPFYTKKEALELKETKGYIVKEVKPGVEKSWRRVVPSPEPIKIVEAEPINSMLDKRVIVIASGGGGIPVKENTDKTLSGVEAVIDKDKAGNILAQAVKADIFMVLTDVEHALINYNKPDQKAVEQITVSEMEKLISEGHFLKGSMGPKVEAAVRFVKAGGEKAIITSLNKAVDAINGKTGTIIIPN